MRVSQRTMWIAGVGAAALVAAWAMRRAGTRGAPPPSADLAAVGQPPRLVAMQRPRPRLRLPRPHRRA